MVETAASAKVRRGGAGRPVWLEHWDGGGQVAEKVREVRETRRSNVTLPLPNLTLLVRTCGV